MFLAAPISLFSAVAFRAAGERVFGLRSMFLQIASFAVGNCPMYAACPRSGTNRHWLIVDLPSFCALCKVSATQPMPIVFCRSGASDVSRFRNRPSPDRRPTVVRPDPFADPSVCRQGIPFRPSVCRLLASDMSSLCHRPALALSRSVFALQNHPSPGFRSGL